MSMDGQGTKWRRNIAENFNQLSRAHKRYKQTTDGRQTTDRWMDDSTAKKPSSYFDTICRMKRRTVKTLH